MSDFDFKGQIKAEALARVVDQLQRFITNDKVLRRIQSENATQFVAFQQGTESAGTILSFTEAQTGANIFSFALLITDEDSGKGRYLINDNPIGTVSSVPRGLPIPSGGYVLEFAGWDIIRNIRWTNETGETINWTYALFI